MNLVCNVIRGNRIESQHIVHAVVLDKKNQIIFSCGDINYITCIRSSLKPFQATALIKHGGHKKFQLSDKELAIICASHSGEKIHTDTVIQILKKIDCTRNDLECGSHPAYDMQTRHEMLKNNISYSNIHNNCSGKHAGMLALAKTLGVNHKGYIDSKHQIQKEIFSNITTYTNKNPEHIAIDGCSVPTPFYSLITIAKMYMKLIDKKSKELTLLYNSITNNPYMIAGKNRFDTDFMSITNGKGISKGGGEAIQGLALETKQHGKISLALKVINGSHLVRDVAIMKILNHLEYLNDNQRDALKKYNEKPIINHNNIKTGEILAELIS